MYPILNPSSLLDEINSITAKVNSFESNKCRSDGFVVISEDEFTLRQELAEKKNNYIDLKNNFSRLQSEEIKEIFER